MSTLAWTHATPSRAWSPPLLQGLRLLAQGGRLLACGIHRLFVPAW